MEEHQGQVDGEAGGFVVNYNVFLDMLERHGLLVEGLCGVIYDELSEDAQGRIADCVDRLAAEFRVEARKS